VNGAIDMQFTQHVVTYRVVHRDYNNNNNNNRICIASAIRS